MTNTQTALGNDKTDSPSPAVTSNGSRKASAHEAQILRLSKEHQKAYKEIHDLLDGQRHNKAKAWYEVGQKVVKIMDASEHGKRDVAKIAELLGRDASLLYDAGRVAKKWTLRQFKTLLKKQDKVRGNRLSWSHLIELERVTNPGRRESLIETILDNGLSVSDLKQAIKGPTPKDDSQPVNVAKALRNFKAESETMAEKEARRGTSVFEILAAQKEKLGTPNMLKLLQDTRKAQLEAIQTCGEQLKKLDECITYSKKLLKTAKKHSGDVPKI